MKEKRATLEVIAPTIEEAIEKGLSDLGLPEEAVDVEVLDQGSRGLFGLGSRQARVRLAVKSMGESAQQPMSVDTPAAEFEAVTERVGKVDEQPQEGTHQASRPEPLQEAPAEVEVEDYEVEEEPAETYERESQEDDQDLNVARETVRELLEKMKIHARVTARFGELDEERGRVPIFVDVRGDDLGILIGRRAEVLNALQYISSLIIGKELGRPTSLVVDVEGYRMRREGQLRQLARRMADQAVKTGRRQVLEPMSAAERRIIHMELRDHPSVKTESIGEEPRRKVTIIPEEE